MPTKKYRYPAMRKLARQLLLSPPRVRLDELERTEGLLSSLDCSKPHAFDFVYKAITGYEPSQSPSTLLGGKLLHGDLMLLCDELAESLGLRASEQSERVYTMDDLVEMFNVSLHAITRWRQLGLVSRKLLFDDGRWRVAFLQSRLDAFLPRVSVGGRRTAELRPVLQEEKSAVVERALDLARESDVSFRDILAQLAGEFNRSAQTIRYILVRHAAVHGGALRERISAGQLDHEEKEEICARIEAGASVDEVARAYSCSRATIHRAYYQVLAQEILDHDINYVPNEIFEHPSADRIILGPPVSASRRKSRHERAARSSQTPDHWLAVTADPQGHEPLLTREEEQDLFRRYNYLKYKVSCLRKGLVPSRAKAGLIRRIRKLWHQAVEIKQRIIRANLGLVISIARRHIGSRTDLGKLISDGNFSLMLAVEKFDFSRGFRFSTYASWAIMKNFAKSIPEESYRLESFVTGTQELMEATGEARNLGTTKEERLPRLREELRKFVNRLPDRDRDILISRFGLFDATPPRTLEQIGQVFHLSKERIRQIEERALSKLRKILDQAKLEALLEE
ncbi:MAG: sigma-70 family RNA polymerase sigma factor [Planctomycetota bacterium]